jgi:hypothetical protein
MRETPTVSLPPKSKRVIEKTARQNGVATSEYVRLAIAGRHGGHAEAVRGYRSCCHPGLREELDRDLSPEARLGAR